MRVKTKSSATAEISRVSGHEIFMVTQVRAESEGTIHHRLFCGGSVLLNVVMFLPVL